jgi:transcriptional regulator of acetoin/glycerol metabolism
MPLLPRPSSRLERRRSIERAWERFVQDGSSPGAVREEISGSWLRARERYAIDPAMSRAPRIISPDELAERRERDPTLRLAAPILRDFASRLAHMGHVLAYFDADGVMLTMDGDQEVASAAEEIAFRPGADWSEASVGTNGPGTALAERRAIEVFASEHYVSAWQPWSCAAAPVHATGDGRPVGLVDLTGHWEVQRRDALLAAKAIARAIHERLRASVSVREEVVRYAFRSAHESGDALVAVDACGRVLAANDAAARQRLLETGALPRDLRELVAGVLRASPRATGDADLRLTDPDGNVVSATPLRHEDATVGALVRVSPPSPVARAARSPRPARAAARYDFGLILGDSEPLRAAVALARTAARTRLPVVLSGESGTGKELFAHAIHAASARAAGPFLAVNCGSIPAPLVEAELFGYEAGTFTGGQRDGKPGRFEDADGGTLFLDEVSELSPQAQTALLRVLQEREVVRVGGGRPRPVEVRVIAATNKPLEDEVRERRFRRDLYYRLGVILVSIPPLRDRGDDLALLAARFLVEAEVEVGRSGLALTDDALGALRGHPWPGNVRELRNVLLRAAATAPRSRIEARDLLLELAPPWPQPAVPAPAARSAPGTPSAPATLREARLDSERDLLVAALEACGWNMVQAARRLGVSRATLYRKMSACGLSRGGA